jgi:hypothetical protein
MEKNLMEDVVKDLTERLNWINGEVERIVLEMNNLRRDKILLREEAERINRVLRADVRYNNRKK